MIKELDIQASKLSSSICLCLFVYRQSLSSNLYWKYNLSVHDFLHIYWTIIQKHMRYYEILTPECFDCVCWTTTMMYLACKMSCYDKSRKFVFGRPV